MLATRLTKGGKPRSSRCGGRALRINGVHMSTPPAKPRHPPDPPRWLPAVGVSPRFTDQELKFLRSGTGQSPILLEIPPDAHSVKQPDLAQPSCEAFPSPRGPAGVDL